jgi:hypothetical protein
LLMRLGDHAKFRLMLRIATAPADVIFSNNEEGRSGCMR